MAIFFLLSQNENPQLSVKVAQTYPNDHFRISDSQWAISSEKISKELLDSLGASEGAFGRVVIAKVEAYYGWHDKSLWEWMEAKHKK